MEQRQAPWLNNTEASTDTKFFVHSTSDVSPKASIGDGTKIWQYCQIREGAVLGQNCILGKGVYIDAGVHIGNNVKIQNGISVYEGVTLEDGVFCGPHCVFTNDREPRSINPDGTLKSPTDWQITKTLVRYGAAIGAHATVVCGVTIGRWAMIGAGSVVTRDVPDYGLVYGNPARLHGFVCPCGAKLGAPAQPPVAGADVTLTCTACNAQITIPTATYAVLPSPSHA
jgi:UDP-2-acetamido-3-amino-2,3-dideoxy-glucuronate N-acetyltransferase